MLEAPGAPVKTATLRSALDTAKRVSAADRAF
jgi:hypothetical protein